MLLHRPARPLLARCSKTHGHRRYFSHPNHRRCKAGTTVASHPGGTGAASHPVHWRCKTRGCVPVDVATAAELQCSISDTCISHRRQMLQCSVVMVVTTVLDSPTTADAASQRRSWWTPRRYPHATTEDTATCNAMSLPVVTIALQLVPKDPTLGGNGAPPEALKLQWSAVGAALERRRSCNGAPPEAFEACNGAPWGLQWSVTGVAMEHRRSRLKLAMERRGGCSGAPPELQWSTGAAMELRRVIVGAAMQLSLALK